MLTCVLYCDTGPGCDYNCLQVQWLKTLITDIIFALMFFFGSFTFRKLYGLSREIPMFLAAIYRAWCIGLFLLATHTCVRMGEICGLVPQACYKVLVVCSDGSAITENNNFCRFMQNNKVHAYVIRHHRHPLCDLWPK